MPHDGHCDRTPKRRSSCRNGISICPVQWEDEEDLILPDDFRSVVEWDGSVGVGVDEDAVARFAINRDKMSFAVSTSGPNPEDKEELWTACKLAANRFGYDDSAFGFFFDDRRDMDGVG